jgi:hypothetical protein
MSSIIRMFNETVAASDVAMYQVSATALYPATNPPFDAAATRQSPLRTATTAT